MEIKIIENHGTHKCSLCKIKKNFPHHTYHIQYKEFDGFKTIIFNFLICEDCIKLANQDYKIYSEE